MDLDTGNKLGESSQVFLHAPEAVDRHRRQQRQSDDIRNRYWGYKPARLRHASHHRWTVLSIGWKSWLAVITESSSELFFRGQCLLHPRQSCFQVGWRS